MYISQPHTGIPEGHNTMCVYLCIYVHVYVRRVRWQTLYTQRRFWQTLTVFIADFQKPPTLSPTTVTLIICARVRVPRSTFLLDFSVSLSAKTSSGRGRITICHPRRSCARDAIVSCSRGSYSNLIYPNLSQKIKIKKPRRFKIGFSLIFGRHCDVVTSFLRRHLVTTRIDYLDFH